MIMFSVSKFRSSAGFTLLEMIITLVIVGFIGVVGTYGLVYGVSIYRSIQGIEVIMPQVDVAMNVITQKIREKKDSDVWGASGTSDKLQLGQNGSNAQMLLDKVKSFKIESVKTFGKEENNNVSKVTLVMHAGAAGAKEKTFVFYVSSNRGE